MTRRKIAVAGSGVAGLTAAYVLQREADVTLYEADARLGGHADTHEVVGSDGLLRNIDTGFIVHNLRTYPLLRRLFGELDIATQESDMSMSISCGGCGLEYAGGRGVGGLLPSRRTVANRHYLRMLSEVVRFHRQAKVLLDGTDDTMTVRQFLQAGRFSPYFTSHFMTPLIAAVWSTAPTRAGDYPARYLFTFLQNHGMLSVTGAPVWYTVVGGSARYVEKAAKGLTAVQTSTPVRAVTRSGRGVEVRTDADTVEQYDGIVIATHPGQALGLLVGADPHRARGAGRDRLHGEPDGAAHRHVGAAARGAGPGVVELRAADLRRGADGGAGQLQHEPAATPRRSRHLRRHAQRRRRGRPRPRHRPDGLRAPGLHSRLRSPRGGGCRS